MHSDNGEARNEHQYFRPPQSFVRTLLKKQSRPLYPSYSIQDTARPRITGRWIPTGYTIASGLKRVGGQNLRAGEETSPRARIQHWEKEVGQIYVYTKSNEAEVVFGAEFDVEGAGWMIYGKEVRRLGPILVSCIIICRRAKRLLSTLTSQKSPEQNPKVSF
ncbi:hypothetical protein C8J57DRAFT_1255823 [Mycena rebaudengoi]|nr:hypothetical protein C8J57DRAFT_1255823 [Mycena rebaudengoi]